MTPYQYARAAEKNLDLGLSDDQRMELARLFRLALDQGCTSFRCALEQIAEEHDAGRHDGLPEPCPAYDDPHTPWLIARAALSDIGHPPESES
jgi:hypothetical protein